MTTQAWTGLNTRVLDGLLLVALFLAVWQGLYEYAGDAAITSPLTTLGYASSLVKTSNFWTHAQATLVAFAYALVISIVLGIVLGLVLGVQRFSGDVAEPILVALYTIPKITLYPLILLIFGLGVSAKVAFGVIHGVIPIILFTLNAVKNINPVLIRTSRVMRLSPWQTASTVLTPAVMPELITGVRVGFSLTMLGVLIGEMFASQRGLGFLIINGINLHNVRITTAVILIVVVFAILANGLLLAFDKRMHRGDPRQRGAQELQPNWIARSRRITPPPARASRAARPRGSARSPRPTRPRRHGGRHRAPSCRYRGSDGGPALSSRAAPHRRCRSPP